MNRSDASAATRSATVDRSGLDRRGWVLILAVLVTFIAIPAGLLVIPPTWLSYHFALLALPVLPAAMLGFLAVWSALSTARA